MSSPPRNKLVGSKWTAVTPTHREKHFLVLGWVEADEGPPELLELEAVYTGRRFTLPWRELKDASRWLQGWRRALDTEEEG